MKAKPERTEEKRGTDFKLVIPDMVYQQIMWWVNRSEHEVSGFGNLDWDPENQVFTVRSVVLLKQEVGPTSTEIDPVALGKAMYETREEANALKWHWHSHVDMGVFWSADDRELIRSLAHQGWILASVFNKKCEVRTAFSEVVTVMGNAHEMFVDEITTDIQRFLPSEVTDAWDKEYDAKVIPEKVVERGSWGNYHRGDYAGSGFGLYGDEYTTEYRNGATIFRPKGMDSEDKELDELNNTQFDAEEEYSDHGYRWLNNRWMYNPMFDSGVMTQAEILKMIDEMDQQDIDQSCKDSPEFREILKGYMVQKAGGKHATK